MDRAYVPEAEEVQDTTSKVMATVLWDAEGVIMLDFLPMRSTITVVYYANLLDQLRTAIHEKRQGKLSKGVLLQQDNTRVHACYVAIDAEEQNRYELIPHPAYSPDLVSSDFFLFPNLKKDIRGCHFWSDTEVVAAVEEWANGKDPDFFSSGLMALERFWSKCITLGNNYIVKEEVDLNQKLAGYLLTCLGRCLALQLEATDEEFMNCLLKQKYNNLCC